MDDNDLIAQLLKRVEELEGAAQFDKAIFAGECRLRQTAVTRALEAEAREQALQQRVEELERDLKVERLALEISGRQSEALEEALADWMIRAESAEAILRRTLREKK